MRDKKSGSCAYWETSGYQKWPNGSEAYLGWGFISLAFRNGKVSWGCWILSVTNEGRLESWADCSLCPQLVSVIDRVCFLQDTPNTPKPGSSCSLGVLSSGYA